MTDDAHDEQWIQQRLFTPPPAAVAVQAFWEYPGGWTVRMQVRRAGEVWADARTHNYENLATDELVDVIGAGLASLLGF